MREWEALVSAALLGTTRRPLDPAVLPEPVRKLAITAADDPERTLLAAAALLSGYRKAGRLPLRDTTVLDPAAADHRALVGPAARYRLARLLFGDYGHLLPEWLAAVNARGLRVPPERLPLLADVARVRPALKAAVAEAAGPRGPWLATLRPEWDFLADQAGADDPRVWRYGTLGQRLTWLTATRSTDPDRARTALAEVWTSEPAPVRTQLLEVLHTGLSTADEEFLEQILDDRAREPRRLAAELLAALPDSALSQRMADRLRPLVTVEGGTIEVRLPTRCDDGMRRDGISPKPPRGVGERAWWLGQLISAAPLAVWAGLDPDPARLVRMPVAGCDPNLLRLGWSAAAVRERNAGWILALLALLDEDRRAIATDQVTRMIAVLPPHEWAPVIARLTRDRLLPALFLGLPTPWPREVGTLVLDRVASHPDRRAATHLADIAAYAVPPESLDHPLLGGDLSDDAPPWLRQLVDTLIFRRAMHEELT